MTRILDAIARLTESAIDISDEELQLFAAISTRIQQEPFSLFLAWVL